MPCPRLSPRAGGMVGGRRDVNLFLCFWCRSWLRARCFSTWISAALVPPVRRPATLWERGILRFTRTHFEMVCGLSLAHPYPPPGVVWEKRRACPSVPRCTTQRGRRQERVFGPSAEVARPTYGFDQSLSVWPSGGMHAHTQGIGSG